MFILLLAVFLCLCQTNNICRNELSTNKRENLLAMLRTFFSSLFINIEFLNTNNWQRIEIVYAVARFHESRSLNACECLVWAQWMHFNRTWHFTFKCRAALLQADLWQSWLQSHNTPSVLQVWCESAPFEICKLKEMQNHNSVAFIGKFTNALVKLHTELVSFNQPAIDYQNASVVRWKTSKNFNGHVYWWLFLSALFLSL